MLCNMVNRYPTIWRNLLSVSSGYLQEPIHQTIWCHMPQTCDLRIYTTMTTYDYCCNIWASEVPLLLLDVRFSQQWPWKYVPLGYNAVQSSLGEMFCLVFPSFQLLDWYMLCLNLNLEDGGNMFFYNASDLLDYKALTKVSTLHKLMIVTYVHFYRITSA
jgi:hypothetical protein